VELVHEIPEAHVEDHTEREQKIAEAEKWVRIAGVHFNRWDEVHDELFGERGKLRSWRSDEQLVTRMHELWLRVRPGGEKVEREEIERAEGWKASRPATETIGPKGRNR
jgi:hypothetical protein